ncbi:MAG TPA: sugar phosphate nucleotidyltransferase [Parvibaculum sp.]
MSWKGILLAGGTGSRLYPLTHAVNKHLLPVFDKPMIYYALTTLMLADIRDIVILSTPAGVEQIGGLLGDGTRLGLRLSYVAQEQPGGIAEGLILAEKELRGHDIALILGDNIFIGAGLERILADAQRINVGATVFGYEVANPSAYGIVTLKDGKPVDLTEKPARSKSRMAVTGLYLYKDDVLDIAGALKPSPRGELEITDVNKVYLEQGRLSVRGLGRGTAWLDGGTPGDLHEAAQFVHVVQTRTGLKIAAPEEIAYRRGFITRDDLAHIVETSHPSEYRDYLQKTLDEKEADIE